MDPTLRIKTAEASEIAGVGYQGFRTWLKRGLLKETGTLPKFQEWNATPEIADAKRWQWSSFGYADLCCFRLAKILFDMGLSWEAVNSIVSHQDVWQSHWHAGENSRYLAIFNRGLQWTLYSSIKLADDLRTETINHDAMTVINLVNLRQAVFDRVNALPSKPTATEVSPDKLQRH